MLDEKKKLIRHLGFNKQIDLIEQQQCPFCAEPAALESFRDHLSKREFEISGLCQTCQDQVFS